MDTEKSMNDNLTYLDIVRMFGDYNREHGYHYSGKTPTELSAVVVISADSFNKPYSEQSRSYRITSSNGKLFFDGMCGNSVWASCLDGTDQNIRLDYYIGNPWRVERCYLEGEITNA